MGLGIILGSVLVKLPQIIKIWGNKSGEGISLFSVFFDLSAITINAAYSYVKAFPFSAWGDSAFLAVQTFLIGLLVLIYSNRSKQAFLFAIIYSTVCYVLMGGVTPDNILWALGGLTIPILLIGKLAQALTNYKNGNTGQLSAITVVLLFAGSLARIFTSIQETGDNMIIVTYLFSTLANAVILFQLLYYWNVDVNVARTKID